MYDIFFVSHQNVNQDLWTNFKNRFPTSQKIDNVKNLEQIKKKSFTKFFYVVWDDIEISSDFLFDYRISEWDEQYVHVFKNKNYFDGVCIFSKFHNVADREFKNRFFENKKEIDIIASRPFSFEKFYISNYDEYLEAANRSTTRMFWAVWNDVELIEELDYQVPIYNQHLTHVFKNGEYFDGICLFSKDKLVSQKEFEYRSFLDKKEIDITLSIPKPYEKFNINSYQQYLKIVESSKTNMFWAVWNDVELIKELDYQVPYYNQHITHIFKNDEHYDGICLFPKKNIVSEKEFKHRFFIVKKEIDTILSKPKKYEQFIIDTYDDYLSSVKNSNTELLWLIPKEVEPIDFNFDLYFSHHNSYDRNMNHVFQNKFRNELNYNGIFLVSKNKILSKKEIDFRFPIEKKLYEIVASQHRSYDIIFISYNEINADDNFNTLVDKFPRAKRVHGVKGIHNAHKKAAELSDTDMFFVVDGDAQIVENFNFDYLVTRYERDIVHIWKSQNPINDLIYGYGGVKLLPKDLVLSMDMNSVDMTTSISSRIKVIDEVSNITKFDVDEFSTWKSAFRECVKLASKPVDESYDEETDFRLQDWCTKGEDRKFGKFALDGARAGREYGYNNIDDKDALSKINDFDFLKNLYEQRAKDIHP
jgi:hypothetical protein